MLVINSFTQNILITLLSILFPLSIGALLSFFASKKETVGKVFGWVSLPFEAICPVVLLCAFFYVFMPLSNNRLLVTVLTFSIAFLGYMPARYNNCYSFLKNLFYNGLGLISTVFKWSFCVGFIGLFDLLSISRSQMARYYQPIHMILPLLISFLFLILIEVAKRLVKQLMK